MTAPPELQDYFEARREHAWLLRAEGLKYREIASRLGVSRDRAKQMVEAFGRRVQRAVNRQRARLVVASQTRQWAIAYQRVRLQAEADRWIEAWITQVRGT